MKKRLIALLTAGVMMFQGGAFLSIRAAELLNDSPAQEDVLLSALPGGATDTEDAVLLPEPEEAFSEEEALLPAAENTGSGIPEIPEEDSLLISAEELPEAFAGKFYLPQSSASIYRGASIQLTALSGSTDVTSAAGITWQSSDKTIADVTAKGKVFAKKMGDAVITAKYGSESASCKIKVMSPYILLDQSSKTLYRGQNFQLKATVAGVSDTVTWSSNNPTVADVTAAGKVFAKKMGDAVITATANGKSKTCTVKVLAPYTVLDQSSKTLFRGQNFQLKATVAGPSQTVTWTSDNPTVADVTTKGKVFAKKMGKAVITASANGKSKTCSVTVLAPSLVLNASSFSLYRGENRQITATVSGPDSTVTWTTTDKTIADVTVKGKVFAKKMGTVTITASANGKTKTCKVTVLPPFVSLSASSATIEPGKTFQLKADIGGAVKTATWTSSNTAVATVSGTGLVTAKAEGSATITASANGKSKSCTITVKGADTGDAGLARAGIYSNETATEWYANQIVYPGTRVGVRLMGGNKIRLVVMNSSATKMIMTQAIDTTVVSNKATFNWKTYDGGPSGDGTVTFKSGSLDLTMNTTYAGHANYGFHSNVTLPYQANPLRNNAMDQVLNQ